MIPSTFDPTLCVGSRCRDALRRVLKTGSDSPRSGGGSAFPRRALERGWWLAAACLIVFPEPTVAQTIQHGLRVPDGFEVTEFSDSTLANDIFCMTLDPKGRVDVSGRGYLRILIDDNGAGKANRAIDFADSPKDGAQGLFWEGQSLYVIGDGGLRRFRVAADGDHADGPSELLRAIKTGGEHDGHAILRGPDGWLYVLCGNNAGIDAKFAQLPTSPIRDPVAGCVLRFTPDLKSSEIVADGFRNPYGMDFNADGDLFTFDSDNERCVSLPWYEPIRFYHVMPGGHYGWQSPQRAMWWRQPPYFCDVVAPVATTGRGSPTGVVCYRHLQFPKKYHGGFFLADWTFGRIYFVPLERQGSSYTGIPDLFLESVGDNGFAPTAMALNPVTGDLYVSIGGRGTRGAVYRIRFTAGLRKFKPDELAELQPKPRSLSWQPEAEPTLVREAIGNDRHARFAALMALVRHRDHADLDEVQRVIRATWDDSDRYVRQAVAALIRTLSDREQIALSKELQTPNQRLAFALAKAPDPLRMERFVGQLLQTPGSDIAARLADIRLLQITLGDIGAPGHKGMVWEGYRSREWREARESWPLNMHRERFLPKVRQAFPAGHPDLDRELSRTLAMLADDSPATLASVAAKLTAQSDPVEDIHYLIVLARLQAPRSVELTKNVADALLALDRKLDARHAQRDRHWPLRVAELVYTLSRKDSSLNTAILANPEFGRADHVLFAQNEGFDRRKAAAIFLARAEKDPDFAWSPALVDVVAALPTEQALPVLRKLWDKGGLEDAILPHLADQPNVLDRPKFIQGLASPRLSLMNLCLDALDKLPKHSDGHEALALVRALRSLPDEKEAAPVREHLAKFLAQTTGQANLGIDKTAWSNWFAKTFPDQASRLGGADGVDVAFWNKRLAAIDWSAGDAERGKPLFTKVNCASCHSGAQALGPDLRGVASRFSRDDLFTAIIQPSKDISPRYRTIVLATGDGKVYQGLIIYEAVDSVILQTGPATTMRLAHQQIAARRYSDISLMPPGLIDKLTDKEIADLYAFLRSMGKGP